MWKQNTSTSEIAPGNDIGPIDLKCTWYTLQVWFELLLSIWSATDLITVRSWRFSWKETEVHFKYSWSQLWAHTYLTAHCLFHAEKMIDRLITKCQQGSLRKQCYGYRSSRYLNCFKVKVDLSLVVLIEKTCALCKMNIVQCLNIVGATETTSNNKPRHRSCRLGCDPGFICFTSCSS